MRLAVIGDIHLFRLKVAPQRLIGKRLLGQGNLWLNRRFRFNHDLLGPVIRRVGEIEPDMVLLTGDVTTTSLEHEFQDMVEHLLPLSQRAPVVMVPGNHDRYTFRSARHRRMEHVMEKLMPERFPHVQSLVGSWELLALDSARPQLMFSRGGLGDQQSEEVKRYCSGLGEDRGLVVLCHYPPAFPPGTPRSWAHEMAGAHALRRMLADCPARVLFVHGHVHKPWHWETYDDPAKQLTCLNAGAPCMTSAAYPLGQGFWEVNLPEDVRGRLRLVHHVPTPDGRYGTKPPKANDVLEPRWHERRIG